ncbi:uncharacterized protein QYS62_005477 [Fusarium acuminatum]|uniref:Uncharacterized protein n=1 Tax=Fusarium acuminatum TaxID=5515 RepID=A0ABZ2WXH2_9HYPO
MPALNNTSSTAAIVTGVAVIAVPALVAGPLLGILGFGAAGITAGSAAAGIQSGIGSVIAPGLFATLQSAGAGGYGVAAVHTVVQAAGVLVAAAGVAGNRAQDGDKDVHEDEDSDSNSN